MAKPIFGGPITDPIIDIRSVTKTFGAKPVLRDLNFSVLPSRIYGLIGESGSGKTTLLRLVNGMLRPDWGQVFHFGEALDRGQFQQARRQMGYCLQGSGLFPHMTVFENMAIIAKRSGWSKQRRLDRASELMQSVNLDASQLHQKITQLSGGQQQRVGLARALFMQPQVILMDEPFGALDPVTREEIQDMFLKLCEQLSLTVVLVTHDLAEAFKMCDELVFLKDGQVSQQGRPSDFLLKPKNAEVREFLKSHSPGQRLEQIKLYSIMNSDLWVTEQVGGSYLCRHLVSGEKKELGSSESVVEHLLRHDHKYLYWESKRQFVGFQDLNDLKASPRVSGLSARQSILDGLKWLLENEVGVAPICDAEGKLVGCLSREALDAL